MGDVELEMDCGGMDLDMGDLDNASTMAGMSGDEIEDDESQGSEPPTPAAKSRRGRPKGKAKAKAESGGKKVIKDTKQRGKCNKAVNGKKYCAPCGKYIDVALFPRGSNKCRPHHQAFENIAAAAVQQGETEWWKSVCENEAELRKVIKAYMAKLPKNPAAKTNGKAKRNHILFNISLYKEEVAQQKILDIDSVHEMMHEAAYVWWASKPKNGGFNAKQATLQFAAMVADPDVSKDMRGPTPELRQRVCVKTKDLMVHKDRHLRSRGYTLEEAAKKKVTAEDVEKLEGRLNNTTVDFKSELGGERSRNELARDMFSAQEAGGGDSAFSAAASGVQSVGKMADLNTEAGLVEDEDEDGDDAGEGGSAGGSASQSGSASASGEKKVEKVVYFDKEVKVSSAISSHKAAMGKLQSDLNSMLQAAKEAIDSVTIKVASEVGRETNLVRNRATAIKLVLGRSRKVAFGDDGAAPEQRCGGREKGDDAVDVKKLEDSTLEQKNSGEQLNAEKSAEVKKSEEEEKKPEKNEKSVESKPEDEKSEEKQDEPKVPKTGNEDVVAPTPTPADGASPRAASATDSAMVAAAAAEDDASDAVSTVAKLVRSNHSFENALLKYIASFADADNSAPCRSYRSLRCLSDFDDIPEKLGACSSIAEIKSVLDAMAASKRAYTELLSMTKAGINRLNAAVKEAVALQAKAAASEANINALEGSAKKRARKGQVTKQPFWDMVGTECIELKSFSLGSGGGAGDGGGGGTPRPSPLMPLDKPCIVQMPALADTAVAGAADSFLTTFRTSPARTDPGRAQRKLVPDVNLQMTEIAKMCFPDDYLMVGDKVPAKMREALVDVTTHTTFGVAKGRETVSTEQAHLPSIRIGIHGSREVVTCDLMSVVEFLKRKDPTKKVKPADACTWLKSCTREQLQSYKAHFPSGVYYGTVGPKDGLYLPAGFIFYERISSASDFIGLRVLVLSSQLASKMQEISRYLMSVESAAPLLHKVCDCLALAS